MEHTKAFVLTSWALRLIVAAILLQTLFFKFSAAKESVYIFSTLGMEPWGRIGSGIFELIASFHSRGRMAWSASRRLQRP